MEDRRTSRRSPFSILNSQFLILSSSFFIPLAVYLATMAPSFTWAHWGADGGDFVAAAFGSQVPHPPGFPVYLVLARICAVVLWGDPAWRLHVLSALMAAGAAMLVAATLRRKGVARWLTLTSAWTLAFAPLFWSQALITEVYTTAACFVALALFWRESPKGEGDLNNFLVGLAAGLSMAVHLTTVLLTPAWLRPRRSSAPSSGPSWQRWALWLGGGALGLSAYAWLPWLGPGPQPWGDLHTLAGWWEFVSARLYHGYAFGLPLAAWPERVLAWAALMARQFTPLGALVILWGWDARRKADRGDALALAGALALLSAYAIAYDTPDSLVYLAPAFPILALLLGEGLQRAWSDLKMLRRVPAWLALLLPALLLVGFWGALDVRQDDEVAIWLEEALAQTPPDAVLVVDQDNHTFALWGAQAALDRRPDVLVVNRSLWGRASYRRFLANRMAPGDALPALPSELTEWAPDRPVCYWEEAEEEVQCP
ncbi:MAG: protein O-mannosyl-transferase family [Anaerolineales bacterium]